MWSGGAEESRSKDLCMDHDNGARQHGGEIVCFNIICHSCLAEGSIRLHIARAPHMWRSDNVCMIAAKRDCADYIYRHKVNKYVYKEINVIGQEGG